LHILTLSVRKEFKNNLLFTILLESGLAESGDRQTLRLWRQLGKDNPDPLTMHLGEGIDKLMLPDIDENSDDPAVFSRQHHDMLQAYAKLLFGKLDNAAELREARD
jgi:hypothetical protein